MMQSWEDIYQSQAPRLLGLCRRYVQDLALAEDLLHDAFLTAIHKQNTYNGSGPLEGWLRKITLNTVLLYLRREKRLAEYHREDAALLPDEPDDAEPSDDPLEMLLHAGIDHADLLQALDALPDHHRTVFNLYVLEQYTHPQIAEALGISVGTSKSHLSRARKKIQTILLSKVQTMQQKKRRAILLFFPLRRRQDAPVDQLYQDAFQNYTIKPEKALPEALKNTLHEAPPPAPALVVAWKGVLGVTILCLAGAGLWWIAYAPAPKPDKPAETGSVEWSLPATAPTMPYAVESPGQPTDTFSPPAAYEAPAASVTAPAGHKAKTASGATLAAQPGGASPAPVVVRKSVVQKDTLYQFTKPATQHEQ